MTGRRQPVGRGFELVRKRTNPANGQSGYRMRARRIASATRIPLGHADLHFLLHKRMLKKIN